MFTEKWDLENSIRLQESTIYSSNSTRRLQCKAQPVDWKGRIPHRTTRLRRTTRHLRGVPPRSSPPTRDMHLAIKRPGNHPRSGVCHGGGGATSDNRQLASGGLPVIAIALSQNKRMRIGSECGFSPAITFDVN